MGDVRKKYDAHNEREVNDLHEKKDEKAVDKSAENEKLQWHPAFFADMQIELEEEVNNLIFENEHQLGTKPKEIDVLVIKKNKKIPVKKNIGRIFRKYNIIEYKSPEDSFGVNDYYKVLAYTYFYKADTRNQDSIKLEELTITFVSKRYPRSMFKHLRKRGYVIKKFDDGIWYVEGEVFPVQIIVTSQLSEEKNFWLKSLTNDLKNEQVVNKIIKKYIKHKDDNYYRSVMDIIIRANKEFFEEGSTMCDAMMEILKKKIDDNNGFCDAMMDLMKDRIDEMNQKSKEDGIRIGEKRGKRQGKRQGKKQGLLLAKKIMRMNADGIEHERIAAECYITVNEVKDILAF